MDKQNHDNQTSKRLYRSRQERIFAGVCGGLAEFFGADPVIVRLVFVLLGLLNGIGVVLYLAMAFIVPSEPLPGEEEEAGRRREKINEFVEEIKNHARAFHGDFEKQDRRRQRKNIIGVILVVFGFLFLLEHFIPFRFLNWSFLWPILLVVAGLAIVFSDKEKSDDK